MVTDLCLIEEHLDQSPSIFFTAVLFFKLGEGRGEGEGMSGRKGTDEEQFSFEGPSLLLDSL